MKARTRNIWIIVLCLIAMVALGMYDITSYGRLTTGFLGMAVLLSGASIYPSIVELVKDRKKDKRNTGL